MNGGIARVGDMDDFAVQSDEETDAVRYFHVVHPHAVKVHNFSIGVGEQREIQLVFGDELLVAFGGIKTHANNLDVVLLQFTRAVAKTARFLGAAGRKILRVKIQQHDLFADQAGQCHRFAVLVLTGKRWRGVADFGHLRRESRTGQQNQAGDGKHCNEVYFHGILLLTWCLTELPCKRSGFYAGLAPEAILPPQPPDHPKRFTHDVAGHFRPAFDALGKNNRHFDDFESLPPEFMRHFNLKTVIV